MNEILLRPKISTPEEESHRSYIIPNKSYRCAVSDGVGQFNETMGTFIAQNYANGVKYKNLKQDNKGLYIESTLSLLETWHLHISSRDITGGAKTKDSLMSLQCVLSEKKNVDINLNILRKPKYSIPIKINYNGNKKTLGANIVRINNRLIYRHDNGDYITDIIFSVYKGNISQEYIILMTVKLLGGDKFTLELYPVENSCILDVWDGDRWRVIN